MTGQRLKTALCAAVLILAGAVLAVKGGQLVAFAQIESALRAYFATQETGGTGLSEATAETLRQSVDLWVDTPILRPRARRHVVALAPAVTTSTDLLLAKLDHYLSVQPADASYWLRRGDLALAKGAPPARVQAAFDLASLLAPNEAGVKFERAMFGFRLWEILTPLQRQRIISDLVAIRARLRGQGLAALSRATAGKDEATKQEMRDLLRRSGPGNVEWATRIGL